MKKVLLLTHYFYPNNTIATQRAAAFAKYLPNYNWQPLVLCSRWTPKNCKNYDHQMIQKLRKINVIEAIPHSNGSLKSLLRSKTMLSTLFRNPKVYLAPIVSKIRYGFSIYHPTDFCIGGVNFLNNFFRSFSVDAIWATFPTNGPHVVADWARSKFNIPWIADFRDIWDIQCLSDSQRFRKVMIKHEPSIVKSSSAIVTVSKPLKNRLEQRHKRNVHVITNGFDPDDYNAIALKEHRKFNILYTGKLYYPSRDPAPLFQAVHMLICQKKIHATEISISFYGSEHQVVDTLLRDFSIEDIVKVFPRVSHRKSITLQMQADVLFTSSTSSRERNSYRQNI